MRVEGNESYCHAKRAQMHCDQVGLADAVTHSLSGYGLLEYNTLL